MFVIFRQTYTKQELQTECYTSNAIILFHWLKQHINKNKLCLIWISPQTSKKKVRY